MAQHSTARHGGSADWAAVAYVGLHGLWHALGLCGPAPERARECDMPPQLRARSSSGGGSGAYTPPARVSSVRLRVPMSLFIWLICTAQCYRGPWAPRSHRRQRSAAHCWSGRAGGSIAAAARPRQQCRIDTNAEAVRPHHQRMLADRPRDRSLPMPKRHHLLSLLAHELHLRHVTLVPAPVLFSPEGLNRSTRKDSSRATLLHCTTLTFQHAMDTMHVARCTYSSPILFSRLLRNAPTL